MDIPVWADTSFIIHQISQELMTAILISLFVAIAIGFLYDHWITLFIIAFSSFALMFLSVVPYFGISNMSQNILISGGVAVGLSGIKYHYVKKNIPELFKDTSFATVMIIMGIIVISLLIMF